MTSNFTNVASFALRERLNQGNLNPHEQVAVLMCHGCELGTVVVEVRDPAIAAAQREAVHWWPAPGANAMDDSVPRPISEAYEEGIRCLAVKAQHGASVMARSALAQIVADKATDTAKTKGKENLSKTVEAMIAEGTLLSTFKDWADVIRDTGNAGAHPESWEPVTLEQAEERLELIKQLVNWLYIQPAQLTAATRSKRLPKSTQDSPKASAL